MSNTISRDLDSTAVDAAGAALDVAFANPELLHAFDRLLSDIEAGRLSLHHIRAMTARYALTREQLERLLAFLDKPQFATAAETPQLSLEVAHHWAWQTKRESTDVRSLISPSLEARLFGIVEAGLSQERVNAHEWAELLVRIAPLSPERAIRLAAAGLVAESHFVPERAESLLTEWAQKSPDVVMNEVGEVMLHHPQRWHLHVHKLAVLVPSLPISVVDGWLQRVGVDGARMLARHLPLPFINPDGEAIVPDLTALVFERFPDDDDVFTTFCAGAHSLQVYSGDIAAEHEREAQIAARFKSHRLRRIRDWAVREESEGKASAEHWREQDALWRTQ